ncbi:MAG TPA: hypothetical protein VGB55_00700 [Tepidisphaeraceae bacterium]|jgi:hypothetical protein
MAGWAAVVFFAVIGPLCLGLLAFQRHALISLLFCTAMSATRLRGGMQFYERIGDPYTLSQAAAEFLLSVAVTWMLSLIVMVPLMEAKRRAA